MFRKKNDYIEIPNREKLRIGEQYFMKHPLILGISQDGYSDSMTNQVLIELEGNTFVTITYANCSPDIEKIRYKQTRGGLETMSTEKIPNDSQFYDKYRRILFKSGLAP